jgi:hypothetical protein
MRIACLRDRRATLAAAATDPLTARPARALLVRPGRDVLLWYRYTK